MRSLPLSLALLAAGCASAPPAPFSGEPRASVALTTRVALPVIEASLSGRAARFLIDTGVATSLFDEAFLAREGLALPLPEVRFGAISVRGLRGEAIALPPELGIAGILAPQEAFAGLLFELDGRAFQVRLYRDLDAAGWKALVAEDVVEAPLERRDGLLFVSGSIDGLPGPLLLDLGAGGCQVSPETAQRLRLVSGVPAVRKVAVGSGAPHREDLFVNDGLRSLGALGYPWALGRRVALDPSGKRLLYTSRSERIPY